MCKDMILAIDFDGTIAHHNYPDLGRPVLGAFRWLRKFQAAGARLILFTMRSDTEQGGPTLTDAVEFCRKHGVEFWGVNENPEQKSWTTSPKVLAHRYVDDAAAGCPLLPGDHNRSVVDWDLIGPILLEEVELFYAATHKGDIGGEAVDSRAQ